MPWDGSFAALAGLHLLESMRQGADRARQDEQSPAERRRKAELREYDAGGAVDIHRNGPSLVGGKPRFERARDRSETAAHRAVARSNIDEFEQAWRTRVARVKAMAEAGDMRDALRRQRCHF